MVILVSEQQKFLAVFTLYIQQILIDWISKICSRPLQVLIPSKTFGRLMGKFMTVHTRDTCLRRGLREDNAHWDANMLEGVMTKSSKILMILFEIIIVICWVIDPMNLWNARKESRYVEISLRAQMMISTANVEFSPVIFNKFFSFF